MKHLANVSFLLVGVCALQSSAARLRAESDFTQSDASIGPSGEDPKGDGKASGSRPEYSLDRLVVKAGRAKDGSADQGYKVESSNTNGPWGAMKRLDTPYSVSAISSEMIENLGASSPDNLFRVNPLTQVNYPQARAGNVALSIRGFRFSTSTLEDGWRNTTGYGVFLEDKERVEVLTGLSGFLYGPANVGGLVNYVSKRPTAERLNSITIGNYGGSNYYVHGDFGGKIDPEGRLAYRVNLLGQDGDTAVDNQSIKKGLASAAIDWHATSKLLFQVNASHGHNRVEGLPNYWSRAAGVKTPAAPDPERLWTQKWTFSRLDSDKLGLNGAWTVNDILSVRAGYSHIENEREWHAINSTIKSDGTYGEVAKIQAPYRVIDNGFNGFLDAKFSTGSVLHKVTFGFYGNNNDNKYHGDASVDVTLAGSFSMSDPTYVAEPSYSVGAKPWYRKTKSNNRNWVLGDDVQFSEQWSAMVGLNRSNLLAQSYGTTGAAVANSNYDKTKLTPSLALIYKPVAWASFYANYMESMEQGTIVPISGSTTYTNAGTVLDPLKSVQYELGTKANLGGMALTAALFYIDKPNEFDRTNSDSTHTYVQDGREVHKGLELTASGRVVDSLTLTGGLTLFDAKVTKTNDPTLEGKIPMDVARQMVKLYAEYDLPCLHGLTVVGGAYYTGAFQANTANTDKLPAVTTGDLGLRYATTLLAKGLVLRLNSTNVTNKSYWTSNFYTGDPRNITFSAQVKF